MCYYNLTDKDFNDVIDKLKQSESIDTSDGEYMSEEDYGMVSIELLEDIFDDVDNLNDVIKYYQYFHLTIRKDSVIASLEALKDAYKKYTTDDDFDIAEAMGVDYNADEDDFFAEVLEENGWSDFNSAFMFNSDYNQPIVQSYEAEQFFNEFIISKYDDEDDQLKKFAEDYITWEMRNQIIKKFIKNDVSYYHFEELEGDVYKNNY